MTAWLRRAHPIQQEGNEGRVFINMERGGFSMQGECERKKPLV